MVVSHKRTNWFTTVLAFIAALVMTALVTGCGGGGDPSAPVMGDQAPAQNPGDMGVPQENGGDGETGYERMIIRTKVLRLEVDKTTDAVDQIRELTRTHSGTISDMQVATDNEEWVQRRDKDGNPDGDGTALRGWVTVRVPSADYEDFIAEVAKLGVVKFQSEATSDVTQEHVDLSARLENLRAQEVRLREFFEAAKDVKDMLAIETELGRVRGEIESLDAQVTFLERQAAMATITVELTEPRPVVRPGGESWGFAEAITSGIRGAAALISGLLAFVIATSPLWIAGLVVLVVVRAVLRRRRTKAARTIPTSPATAPEPVPTPEK